MIDIDVVIDKIKTLKGLKNDKEVAALLGLSSADFSNRKKRGSLLLMIFEWAGTEDVSLDWLTTKCDENFQATSQVVTGDGNIQAGGSIHSSSAGVQAKKLHGRLDPEVAEVCELLQQYGNKSLLASIKEKLLTIKGMTDI
jgi:hypothetical protein